MIIPLAKLFAAIDLKPADARLLCRFTGLGQLPEEPEATVTAGFAAAILVADFLFRVGMKTEQVYGIISEAAGAVVGYASSAAEEDPDKPANLFALELLENTYAVWPGVNKPFNFLTGMWEESLKVIPIMSVACSVTGLVYRVIRPLGQAAAAPAPAVE